MELRSRHLIASLILLFVLIPTLLMAQDERRLQTLLDACDSDRVCELPAGRFVLSEPLRVSKSMIIRGAGGGPRKKPHRRVTELRVNEKIPAFVIQGNDDITVSMQDLVISGGGIHAGGVRDPCRGIDDPFDLFPVHLFLQDITIQNSMLNAAIFFGGGSLSLKDVQVTNNMEGSGLYVAHTSGDIAIVDAKFNGNERWGVYICNQEGTGQIFINDVVASQNGRGGIAIVGKGSPPAFRTLCMQNTGTAFNFRFGILLFDVAKSLLFNIQSGFTQSEPGGLFGDGIAVSASDDVYFWDVTVALNNRTGFFAFGPHSINPTHIHLTGNISALNNGINAAVEGFGQLDAHTTQTTISGLCGFTTPLIAPPLSSYCEENLQPVSCTAVPVNLAPPEPSE